MWDRSIGGAGRGIFLFAVSSHAVITFDVFGFRVMVSFGVMVSKLFGSNYNHNPNSTLTLTIALNLPLPLYGSNS